MAGAVAFLDADGATPISSVFYGLVPPGSSYHARNSVYRKIVVKNVGDEAFDDVLVTIVPAGLRDGSSSVRIATGSDPNPEDFKSIEDGPLSLGFMDVEDDAELWVDIVEPIDAQLALGKGWTFEASGIPSQGS